MRDDNEYWRYREICEAADRKQHAQRAANAVREHEYRRAQSAAIAWTGVMPSVEAIRYQRHIVDLALQPPPIEICWLLPDSKAANLVEPVGGVAFGRHGIWVKGINCFRGYLCVAHEIAHERVGADAVVDGIEGMIVKASSAGEKLAREINAWAWARHHALTWNLEAHEEMTRCLRTHLRDASLGHLPEVTAADALCSRASLYKEMQRRAELDQQRHEWQYGGQR